MCSKRACQHICGEQITHRCKQNYSKTAKVGASIARLHKKQIFLSASCHFIDQPKGLSITGMKASGGN
jgi:hypothetical protein